MNKTSKGAPHDGLRVVDMLFARAYARLFTEVRARDAQANVLRFGGMGDLSHMIDGFPNQDVNAALVVEAGDEDALAAVESISRDGRAGQILVLADSRDPAWFARLFYAGATEVIAAGPLAASSIESNEACAVRGPMMPRPLRGPLAITKSRLPP